MIKCLISMRVRQRRMQTTTKERERKDKMLKKKICAGLLAAALTVMSLFANTATARAEETWPGGIDTQSAAAIVMELETGAILYEKNIHATYYPASITKILTALVALEHSSLDEVVTFSEDAVYLNEGDTSHISRDVGEQMTMEQCLYGMLLESANECAYAIAEHVGGGDVNVFVDMMNQKAAELGCQDSYFNNTNGLPDENHYVSAYDMALISRAAYQNPTFAKMIGTKSYQIPPTNTHADPTPLNNHHSMLHPYHTSRYVYPYCLGGKTGYTDASNSTLVTYAAKDGMTLVCVVLNVTSPGHWTDTTNLFNYCFDNFAVYNVADQVSPFAGDADGSLGSLGEDMELVSTDPHGTVVLPKTASLADAQASVTPLESEDDAALVGQVTFTYAGHYVGQTTVSYQQSGEGTFPFHNLDPEKGGSQIRSININFFMIFLTAAVLAVVVLGIFALGRTFSRIGIRRRRRRNAIKKKKPAYRQIRRNRRRGRRY